MKKTFLKRERRDSKIWEEIVKIWKEFPGLGYRKIAKYLNRNKKLIQRIIQKFKGKQRQTRRLKKIRRINLLHQILEDLVKNPDKQKRGNWNIKEGKNSYRKLLEPTRPYQLWTEDWKEFKAPIVKLTVYIFIVIDAYTRQLMGFNISMIKTSQSAIDAEKMAVKKAKADILFNPRKLIIHRDNGSAYIAEEDELYLKDLGIKPSYSNPGKPTQNPYSEAFISILSRFWLKHFEFTSTLDLEKSLTKFFSKFNSKWKHSGIGYLTPDEKLEKFRKLNFSKFQTNSLR
jgi:transposase InsO family protein